MILFPELKAVAKCEAPDCGVAVVVAALLTVGGGLGVAAEGWQFLPGSDGAFHSFCPVHHKDVSRPLIAPGMQLGPAGLKPLNGRRG